MNLFLKNKNKMQYLVLPIYKISLQHEFSAV